MAQVELEPTIDLSCAKYEYTGEEMPCLLHQHTHIRDREGPGKQDTKDLSAGQELTTAFVWWWGLRWGGEEQAIYSESVLSHFGGFEMEKQNTNTVFKIVGISCIWW